MGGTPPGGGPGGARWPDGAASRCDDVPVLYVVIPAGGSGTRLWPLSRAGRPKFLLPLVGLRAALLCQDDPGVIDAALQSALAVGATSGADTVSGLLAAVNAWLPAPAAAAAA